MRLEEGGGGGGRGRRSTDRGRRAPVHSKHSEDDTKTEGQYRKESLNIVKPEGATKNCSRVKGTAKKCRALGEKPGEVGGVLGYDGLARRREEPRDKTEDLYFSRLAERGLRKKKKLNLSANTGEEGAGGGPLIFHACIPSPPPLLYHISLRRSTCCCPICTYSAYPSFDPFSRHTFNELPPPYKAMRALSPSPSLAPLPGRLKPG